MQEEGALTLNMNAKNKITIPNVGGIRLLAHHIFFGFVKQ